MQSLSECRWLFDTSLESSLHFEVCTRIFGRWSRGFRIHTSLTSSCCWLFTLAVGVCSKISWKRFICKMSCGKRWIVAAAFDRGSFNRISIELLTFYYSGCSWWMPWHRIYLCAKAICKYFRPGYLGYAQSTCSGSNSPVFCAEETAKGRLLSTSSLWHFGWQRFGFRAVLTTGLRLWCWGRWAVPFVVQYDCHGSTACVYYTIARWSNIVSLSCNI